MAASRSGEEPGGRPWTATSTWAPAPGGGAVEDAVSFETTDFDAEAVPAGVVLSRPPPDGDGDVPPCEVTVSFRGKYEIHRVYVRSTARIYEIYHSTETKGTSKDYLCTVRCGLAVKEPQFSGEESMAQLSDNPSTTEKCEREKSVSSSCSDEDSWVDVKIPESSVGNNTSESPERNVAGTGQENTLAHYEATAEMTDVTPCVSLTIRLLSLQSKTSVHIEEIYIFADPVESTNDDSVTGSGNMGGSSLLAMLVPGLMQMRSRNLKIDDKYFSDGSRTQLTQDHALKESSTCEKIAQEAEPCNTNDSKYEPAIIESGIGINRADGGTVSSEKSEKVEFQFKDPKSLSSHLQTTENTQVPSVNGPGVSNTDQHANPLMNENYTHNNIERKLDILLSKVENMELYCSRFEDSMIKPLGSIEARLQRLEQQFDSFSVEIQFLRGSSTRMSAPEGLSEMSNSQGKAHNDGNAGTASITDRKPGLAVRAPDFSSEDSCGYSASNENQGNFRGPNVVPRLLVKVPDFIAQPELTGEKLCTVSPSPIEDALSSEKGRKSSPGLVVKVPEFPDDDDDEVEEENEAEISDHGEDQRQYDDTLNKSTADNSKNKKPVSINGALASALDTLLTSTKGMPSSKSILCAATNLSAENTTDSLSCSLSPKKIGEMSPKDVMADQFLATSGNANLDGTSVSYQEIDETPHTSLSNAMLDGKFEVNEQYNDLSSDKASFVGSTELLDSQCDTVDESFGDASEVNGQNNCRSLETMPFVASAGPLDPPEPPTGSEEVDNGVHVNENRPAISLAEFLVGRRDASSCKNGTSVVCCGNGGAEKLSFERTMAGAGEISKNTSLLKKALDIDVDDTDHFCSDPTAANFERSCNATSRDAVNGHNINSNETVSDKDHGLENTENSCRLFVGMNSVLSQYCAADSNKKWIQNSRSDWRLDESFLKQSAEDSLSCASSMESFSGAPAKEPVVSANTTSSNYAEDLLAGIGVCSTATPIAGEELKKVCDLLYEYKDDMLGMAFTAKGTRKSGPSLEVLLGESSDSEGQVSDLENVDNSGGMGSAPLFSTLSSSDDGASAADEPLVDVADLTTPAEASACALNEPLFDVAGLTNPSDVNEPFACVVDVPNPSEADVSHSQCLFSWEPLAGADDLPKPQEAFSGGSSGEHSDSLI